MLAKLNVCKLYFGVTLQTVMMLDCLVLRVCIACTQTHNIHTHYMYEV